MTAIVSQQWNLQPPLAVSGPVPGDPSPLGSPLWHYGRTLYVEAFAAGLLVCAYAAVLRSYRYVLAGLLIGAAMALVGSSRLWNLDGRAFAAIVLLMVISVEFGAIAAFTCKHINDKHPIQLML